MALHDQPNGVHPPPKGNSRRPPVWAIILLGSIILAVVAVVVLSTSFKGSSGKSTIHSPEEFNMSTSMPKRWSTEQTDVPSIVTDSVDNVTTPWPMVTSTFSTTVKSMMNTTLIQATEADIKTTIPSTTTTEPPNTAYLLNRCEMIRGIKFGPNDIEDMCWLDRSNLIVAQSGGRQILLVSTDITGCNYTIIDKGEYIRPSRVCCSETKELFVVDQYYGVIYIYNLSAEGLRAVKDDSGLFEETENEQKLEQEGGGGLAVNRRIRWHPKIKNKLCSVHTTTQYILVIECYGEVHLYDHKRAHVRSFHIGHKLSSELGHTELWNETVLFGTIRHTKQLMITNLIDNSTVLVGRIGGTDDSFNFPVDVAVNDVGLVLVSDYFNIRVIVFTLDGSFLGQIDFLGNLTRQPHSLEFSPKKSNPFILALSEFGVLSIFSIRF